MSFKGKLIKIENAPDGNRSAGGFPEITYKRWRLVTLSESGVEEAACTGRKDIVMRAIDLMGKNVTILRGGKAGIMGGIKEEM